MKKTILALSCIAAYSCADAQTCKIKISYDSNGNRIQRSKECTGRPAPQADSTGTGEPGSWAANLSNNEDQLLSFSVYPNPSNGKFTVKLNQTWLLRSTDILILDALGKELYSKKHISQQATDFDLSGLADGTYYVVLFRDQMKRSIKIIKYYGKSSTQF